VHVTVPKDFVWYCAANLWTRTSSNLWTPTCGTAQNCDPHKEKKSGLLKFRCSLKWSGNRVYFWTGEGNVESIVRSWQARLKKLFDLAEVPKGQGNAVSHRFRDTFAVELLLAGVPIERVSILLGHQSVRVTERHYNPWVRSRQEQLEADVASAWKQDPVLNDKNFGTNQVHLPQRTGQLIENKRERLVPGVGVEPT
jgi:hypothetical protein